MHFGTVTFIGPTTLDAQIDNFGNFNSTGEVMFFQQNSPSNQFHVFIHIDGRFEPFPLTSFPTCPPTSLALPDSDAVLSPNSTATTDCIAQVNFDLQVQTTGDVRSEGHIGADGIGVDRTITVSGTMVLYSQQGHSFSNKKNLKRLKI